MFIHVDYKKGSRLAEELSGVVAAFKLAPQAHVFSHSHQVLFFSCFYSYRLVATRLEQVSFLIRDRKIFHPDNPVSAFGKQNEIIH